MCTLQEVFFFNDYNKKCIKVIKNNLERFNVLKQAVITNLDYKKALDFYKEEGLTFDLIFLDPPYKEHIIEDILTYVSKNNLLNATEMREEITWGTVIGSSSTNVNSTKLNFHGSYWDFSPINQELSYVSINDL